MEDRRQPPPRSRTLRAAKIVFNRHGSVIDCMVRNVSERGACLVVEAQLGVPPRFDLIMEPDHETRAAHVIWRNAIHVGVRLS